MRKHLSVIMFIARSSACRLACLLVLMSAAQIAAFLFIMDGMGDMSLGLAFSRSRTGLICAVSFVLYMAVLCLPGCEFGAKSGYTLRRLRISERMVYFWQAGYNLCCFLIFWFVQLAVVLLLCRIYMSRTGGPQDVFLAFYRHSFLHSLLPLDETTRYARNAFLAVALGLTSAYFPFSQRYGRIAVSTLLSTGTALVLFSDSMGSTGTDMIVMFLSTVYTAAAVWGVLKRRTDHEAGA